MIMAKIEYCIIGLGKFGQQLADQLKSFGKGVMVLDIDESLIESVAKKYDLAIKCDCTNISNLIDVGIKNVKNVIVACTNVENQIMICANLKHLEISTIIAQAKNKIQERVLKTLGVTKVIIPEIDAANKIAIQCVYNLGADVSLIGPNMSFVKTMVINADFTEKNLLEMKTKIKFPLNIVFIQRKDTIIFPITNETKLKVGDIVSMICQNKDLKKTLHLFSKVE